MLSYLNYVYKGVIHYLSLIFDLFDFIDLGTMYGILGVIVFTFIISSSVRKSIIKLIPSAFNILKTVPGFLFFVLFLSYYVYVFVFFQSKTISIILLTIYLFLKDFYKTNLDMLNQEKYSTFKTIVDISIPVGILFLQQIVLMLEICDFSNINYVLLSLIIIPIFSLLFFLNKHFSLYDVFYKRFKQMVNMNDYELYKIYSNTLCKCGNYELTDKLLSMIILKYRNLTYAEMKLKLSKESDILLKKIIIKTVDERKQVHCSLNKTIIIINYFWLLNIVIFMVFIMFKCYSNFSSNGIYKVSFIILTIYLWCDLMKSSNIENQYNFTIYLFINAFIIFLLYKYSSSISATRLSEYGFLLPIFIFAKFKNFYKTFPSFLSLPYITDNNFFGLKVYDKAGTDYKKK